VLTNKKILPINHLLVKVAVSGFSRPAQLYVPTAPEFLWHFGIDLIAKLLPPNSIEKDY